MSRFVILEHDHPTLHFDLMLEVGAVLWSWRLDGPPTPSPGVGALRTPNHRRLYLDYEGPVSGNRGSVRRWDEGTFTWLENSESLIVVRLDGERLAGTLRLICEEGENWRALLDCAQSP
jgi:hypothetical protein